MEALQIMPNQVSYPYPVRSYEEAQVIDLLPKKQLQFIEANTKEVDFNHLKQDCVIPVFSKDNEVTISHTSFIETVQDAISRVLPNVYINPP